MADRKNTSKYYPADFDPSKLGKRATKPRRAHVNFACPFRSMRCLSCGSFTTRGTKFYNAIKQTSSETYLRCQIIRLYTKCPGCKAAIVIETDPKNSDYRLVSGAKRCFEPWKNADEAEGSVEGTSECLGCEESESDEWPIQTLEGRLHTAKEEMRVADALDDIRAANNRRNAIELSSGDFAVVKEESNDDEDIPDAAAAREAFQRVKEITKCTTMVQED